MLTCWRSVARELMTGDNTGFYPSVEGHQVKSQPTAAFLHDITPPPSRMYLPKLIVSAIFLLHIMFLQPLDGFSIVHASEGTFGGLETLWTRAKTAPL